MRFIAYILRNKIYSMSIIDITGKKKVDIHLRTDQQVDHRSLADVVGGPRSGAGPGTQLEGSLMFSPYSPARVSRDAAARDAG